MEVRDRAIWARVDWTAQGAEWVASGAYKFLSIGYFVDKASGEIKRIKSAGLTNTPGFRMPELARADNDKETDMDKDVLEALGLKPDATTADAVAKITELKSTVETARAGPDRDKYVPRAQHEAALARIDKFEQADTARATQELTGLVEEGIEAGKIAPAAKDDFIEMARAQGTEKFRATLDKLLDIPIVGDVRGAGYFYGIELVKDKATKESFSDEECERILYGFVSPALFQAGLYCRADDRGDPVIQLSPPLIIGQAEFDEMERILRDVLTRASALI